MWPFTDSWSPIKTTCSNVNKNDFYLDLHLSGVTEGANRLLGRADGCSLQVLSVAAEWINQNIFSLYFIPMKCFSCSGTRPRCCNWPCWILKGLTFFVFIWVFSFPPPPFSQDVQLHGRWVVLCRSGEHTPYCLHGDGLLDAVSPLQQLHAPGPVAVLRAWEMHDTHGQHR